MMRAAIWKQIAVVFLSAVVLSFLTASLFSDGDRDAGTEYGPSADWIGDQLREEEMRIRRERTGALAAMSAQRPVRRQLTDALIEERVVARPVPVDPHPHMPGFVKRPYWLDEAAAADPFHVLEMWHDGRFTWLRADAGQRPALYQPSDTDDSDLLPLGMYPATEGLYVVDPVAREGGWIQTGNDWAQWRLDGPEDER